MLPEPPLYTPWTRGVYEVSPALRPLGTDFGNGPLDQVLFQFDRTLPRYRANKQECLALREDHILEANLADGVRKAAYDLISARLAADYGDAVPELLCGAPTDDDPLTALVNGLQEDVAIVSTDGDRDWISYLHLCSPSHWAAGDKIGHSFMSTHAPIPHFERVNAAARGLVESMVHRGPFVRFVWSLGTDDALNHHPRLPAGRDFDRAPFMVRWERQCLWGMPSVGAALFTIRVGFGYPETVLADEHLKSTLRSSLLAMSPESRRYKGVDRHFDALLAQLA